MTRRIRLVAMVACVVLSLLVVGAGPALAFEASPTLFQRAIASWMGVVALVADDGAEAERHEDADEEEDEGDDHDAHRDRRRGGDRGDRAERGDWSGRGRRGPAGPPPHPRMEHPRVEHPQRMRAGSPARVEEIIDRLTRIEQKLDRGHPMGNPWSPRPAEAGRGERPRPPHAAMPPEAQERMRGMMEEGRRRMAEAHEKMAQARKKFQEMEERIKKLEAEVERLKASR